MNNDLDAARTIQLDNLDDIEPNPTARSIFIATGSAASWSRHYLRNIAREFECLYFVNANQTNDLASTIEQLSTNDLVNVAIVGFSINDDEIEQLALSQPNLTYLDLGRNTITDVGAQTIAQNLPQLTRLTLLHNNITDIGATAIAEHLPKLTELDIYSNGLTDMGAEAIAKNLRHLRRLYLGNNDITDAGAEAVAYHLSQLTHLGLSGNSVTSLTTEAIAKNLSHLTHLHLSRNDIDDSGAAALSDGLSDLTYLGLGGNDISDVGAQAIAQGLPHLTHLGLNKNNITDDGVKAISATLTDLVQLHLDENDITDAGAEAIASGLTQLVHLGLNDNHVSDTGTKAIANKLHNMERLYLSENQLTKVGAETIAYNLSGLQRLYLGDNNVTNLGARAIARNLPHLTHLDLTGNGITNAGVDAIARHLSGLTHLRLNNNGITNTGAEAIARNLHGLAVLHIDGNQLNRLPLALTSLDNLEKFSATGNPWSPDFQAVVNRQGTDGLGRWLQNQKEGSTRFGQAKVLVLGEGAVGKTSLVAQLCRKGFVTRPSTHGIELGVQIENYQKKDYTLRYWDFGGQALYRITHPFFFSSDTVYVVAWHGREGTERGDVTDWLERIKLRVGRRSRILLVATNCGDHNPTPDISHLERSTGVKIVGFYPVENQTGEGIDELRKAILDQVVDLGTADEPWPLAYQKLSNSVDQLDKPQISWSEFVELGREQGLQEDDCERTAIKLSTAGRLTYFKDPQLQGKVILKPDWLTTAISYVLNDSETSNVNHGRITLERLREIWSNPPVQSGEQTPPFIYERAEVPFLVELMQLYGIAFRPEPPNDQSLLVAQMVPHERPEELGIPDSHRSYRTRRLQCDLGSKASRLGLIPGLTARNHSHTTGTWWRDGLVLHNPAQDAWALFERLNNSTIELTVWAQRPSDYFSALRSSLEARLDEWAGIDPTYLVMCPTFTGPGGLCGGHWSYDELSVELHHRGDVEKFCASCKQLTTISELLIDVPTSTVAEDIRRIVDEVKHTSEGIHHLKGGQLDLLQTMQEIQADQYTFFSAVLQVLDTEIRDTPRLVTITPEDQTVLDPRGWIAETWKLQFWCEHVDEPHPCDQTYQFKKDRDWFKRCSPYLKFVSAALKLTPIARQALTLAESVASPLPYDKNDLEMVRASIQATEAIAKVATLDPTRQSTNLEDHLDLRAEYNSPSLRVLRELIHDIGAYPELGGLRRTKISPTTQSLDTNKSSVTSDGMPRWICADHYHLY